MEPVALQGTRLLLREMEASDLPAISDMLSGAGQVRYIEFEETESSARSLLDWSLRTAQDRPRVAYSLTLTLPPDNTLIGSFTLVLRNVELREGHLGVILNRRYQGKGLAVEAGEIILAFAFEQLGLHRLCAACHAGNKASIHLSISWSARACDGRGI
jgi:[ribosomal protein S5]-alanine N-acetyltransferase